MLSGCREKANKRPIVRAAFVIGGYCRSTQNGSKDFAEVFFDSSNHESGWKVIPSQNIGKLLNAVEANTSVVDFPPAFVLTPIYRKRCKA